MAKDIGRVPDDFVKEAADRSHGYLAEYVPIDGNDWRLMWAKLEELNNSERDRKHLLSAADRWFNTLKNNFLGRAIGYMDEIDEIFKKY